jgi:hypothetical protein
MTSAKSHKMLNNFFFTSFLAFKGSFFLPMLVMVYVYLRISCVVANRHDDMVQINVNQVRKLQPVNDLLKNELFIETAELGLLSNS